MNNNTLQNKLNRLFALRRDGKGDLAIRPEFFTLLQRLGNPQKNLPPVIHVAGTNGKGSTIAFMRAILEAAGYSVHVYTSPHLVRFNERVVLNGQMIDDSALEILLDEVLEKSADLDLSFFELTPALGFAAFARTQADILLLETGLGGRLDHTNIVDAPLLSVITTLSYDHTHLLGDTIELIAREKAGIMKPGVPCLVGHQIYPEALDVLKSCGNALSIPVIDKTHWPRIENLTPPNLVGAHQRDNAGLAVAALLTQTRLAIPETAFHTGVTSARWPARLQKIETLALPPGWELWLDGGHNDSAGLVLAEQARHWAAADGKNLHIITGMMGHKDAASFARALANHAASVTTIPVPGHDESCTPPESLAQIWRDSGAVAVTAAIWPAALEDCLRTGESGRILLTGSLYLAQTVL
ncbi:MAG: bifunctional folylpolyglutamate synthase/dihydrofolate synthase [Micavibrio sp.]